MMDVQQSSSNIDQPMVVDLDKELTNKFLRGEISFTDYSSEWYGKVAKDNIVIDDDEDNYAYNNQQTAERSSTVKRRKLTRLSNVLLGLMGEANLRFVRGEKEVAEKMCHEIIKQVPTASEPYQTLAQIYEHDPEKSLQFSLLAAHLSPSDADEWLRLAEISKQRNDAKQEMLCYTQAIKAQPTDISIHLKRLDLLQSLEGTDFPLQMLKLSKVKCYHKIVTSLPSSEGATIMKYAKLSAILYHKNDEEERAMEVMNVAYEKCGNLFKMEDINLYCELLIGQKEYQACLEVFVCTSGVEVEAEIETVSIGDSIEEQTNYVNCSIPDDLPIDLRTKLLICLIHLGAVGLVQSLLQEFLNNDVERASDLYLDIEEALSSTGQHELALRVLDPLVKNIRFDLGAVWLKHAECLFNLGRKNDAISSYYKVINLAPQHIEARRKLFHILEEQGEIDKALEVLQQDYTLVVSARLLYDYCCALKKYNKILKYLEVGEALLSKTFVKYRHQAELNIARMVRSGIELVHNFRITRGEKPYNDDDIQFDEDEAFHLSGIQEWELLNELLYIAFEHKKFIQMQRLSFGAFMSKKLTPYRSEIDFYCIQTCLFNNNHIHALPIIKEFVQKYGEYPMVWNILNIFFCNSNKLLHSAHFKFMTRLFEKGKNVVKYLFYGNNYLVSGRYLPALKSYLCYHEHFKDPFTALLIAITILVMAAQRTMDKHHSLVLQGLSYLMTYQHLRNWDEESYYNLGRAFQMMSINNLAIEYYEKVLSCKEKIVCEHHGEVDLKKEAAFNLYLLYKDHSPHMAQRYIQKYIVI